MERKSTSERLNEIMIEKEMRQADLLRRVEPYAKALGVKMNRSDISQYVSGKVEPNQDKLYVLSQALDVEEAWLMGFDVDRKKKQHLSWLDTEESVPMVVEKCLKDEGARKRLIAYATKLMELKEMENFTESKEE